MPPRTRRLILLLAALSLLSLPGLAQSLCPQAPEAATARMTAAERLRSLGQRYADCANDVGFLAWYGALLLEAGQAQAAADVLERALLLDPQHQGARLDYARALLALGERAAAAELLAGLAARPDLPPAAQDFLAALAAAPPSARSWHHLGSLGLRGGYDDNLNRATQARSLTLTLPGGNLDLPLTREGRARAGPFLGAEFEGQAWRSLTAGRQAQLAARLAGRIARQGTDEASADLAAWLSLPATGAQHRLGAGWGQYLWDGEVLQRYTRLSWQQDTRTANATGACVRGPGLHLDDRRHPANPLLDYRLLQASYGWTCATQRPWLLQASLGREFAQHDRPGGDAWRLALRAHARWPLNPAEHLEAQAQLAWRRDDAAYSPLLGNGTRLGLQSLQLRLEWRRALAPGWEAVAALDYEHQAANLALFDLERRVLSLGLVRRW